MASIPARHVYLYDGIAQPWFSLDGVREHLLHWLPWLRIEIRSDLLARGLGQTDADLLANMLCQVRVRDPLRNLSPRRPLKPEIDYEARVLAGETRATPGVVYDGNELQRIAFTGLPREERRRDVVHVWFTERLFATWDEDDRRYHARASVYGQPSIISSSGLAHAPAKQREFYIARRLGVSAERAAADHGDQCLKSEDPRTTKVAKGYGMQALFYALTGDAFCDDPGCRLFNAHWQAEMLNAQLEGDDYCAQHRDVLREWATMRTD